MSKYIVSIVAIIAVAVLCIVALLNGVDGALYMTSVTVIAGLGGYYIARRIKR